MIIRQNIKALPGESQASLESRVIGLVERIFSMPTDAAGSGIEGYLVNELSLRVQMVKVGKKDDESLSSNLKYPNRLNIHFSPVEQLYVNHLLEQRLYVSTEELMELHSRYAHRSIGRIRVSNVIDQIENKLAKLPKPYTKCKIVNKKGRGYMLCDPSRKYTKFEKISRDLAPTSNEYFKMLWNRYNDDPNHRIVPHADLKSSHAGKSHNSTYRKSNDDLKKALEKHGYTLITRYALGIGLFTLEEARLLR